MNIWHLNLLDKPQEHQYMKKYFQVAIFVPEVPPLPESDDEIVFCQEVNLLPV